MEDTGYVIGLMYVCVVFIQVAPVILSEEEATAAAGTSDGGVVRSANISTTPVEGTGADACCGFLIWCSDVGSTYIRTYICYWNQTRMLPGIHIQT